MVRVVIERGPDGSIRGFAVHGHAGHGARGTDIVCAAVSAISQTAVLGLETRLGIQSRVVAGSGSLNCRVPEGLDPAAAVRVQDVLETMCLGLRAIAAGYPQRVAVTEAAAKAREPGRRTAFRGRAAGRGATSGLRSARGTAGGDLDDGAHVDV